MTATMAVSQSKENDSLHTDNKVFTDDGLLFLLSEQKWKDGFVCRKCGHDNFCKGNKPFSRRCTKCKTTESATAHTIFHRCKIPLNEAFVLASIVCCNPKTSSYAMNRTSEIRQMTCWKLKTHILECLGDPEKSQQMKELMNKFQHKPS